MKLLFEVDGDGSRHEFDVFDSSDLEGSTAEFAEYCYDNLDGWEWHWPIDFKVYKPDGTFLAKVAVIEEMQPHFYGRIVKAEIEKETM